MEYSWDSYWSGNAWLVALDGASGTVLYRYALPKGSEIAGYMNGQTFVPTSTRVAPAATLPPVIGPDGTAFAAVRIQNRTEIRTTLGDFVSDSGNQTLSLLRMSPAGAITLIPLKTVVGFLGGYTRPGVIIPDGNGGAFAAWYTDVTYQGSLTHIPVTGTITDIATGQVVGQMVLGENGVAFAQKWGAGTYGVTAYNAGTLASQWTYSSPDPLDLVVATADGGVIVRNRNQGLIALSATGTAGSAYTTLSGALSNPPAPIPWAGADWLGVVDSSLIPAGSTSTWQLLSSGDNRPADGRTRQSVSMFSGESVPSFAMLTSLPTYVALSTWAYPKGNGQTQNVGITQTTLKLVWCGTGYGKQGPCAGHANVTFGYADDPDPQTQLQDFSAAHPDWVDIVENEALNAFKKAFRFYPAIYILESSSSKTGEHVVKITGDFPANYANGSTPFQQSQSFAYYAPILRNAEIALAPTGQARFIPQGDGELKTLLSATGRGIGNVAAHETGHQLGLPGMDCGDPDAPGRVHCERGNNSVYNFFSSTGYPQNPSIEWSTGGQFFYLGNIGISWSPSAACALWDIGIPYLQSATCPNR